MLSQEGLTDESVSKCRNVSSREFLALATSRLKLVRSNDPAASLLGLYDPDSREKYRIEERQLMRVSLADELNQD